MGVSGAGKTTVARSLAKRLGAVFIDGDDVHTDEARAKMRSGKPLDDSDRWPWLDRIGAALAVGLRAESGAVVACSALKRAYRDRLRAAAGPALTFVYLDADPQAMRRRVGGRSGHYMPATLVDSQFAALEPPRDEPDVIVVSAQADVETTVADLAARLASPAPPAKETVT
jgi:gluconokinase